MADVIEGTVLDIIDGDTLEMELDRVVPPAMPARYHAVETVRIVDEASRGSSPQQMEQAHANCRIRCHVEDRDEEGILVARIDILDEVGEDYGDQSEADEVSIRDQSR